MSARIPLFCSGFLILFGQQGFPTRTVTVQSEPSAVTKEELVTDVRPEEWFILQYSEPKDVWSSPPGIVDVTEYAGPMAFRGKFPGGGGKIETRMFDAEHIYSIEATGKGKVEILVVPKGTAVIRQVLTVSGEGPRPPPDIDPPPDVDPPIPTPVTGLRVLLLGNEDATREQLSTLNSTLIVQWMDANCEKLADGRSDWRRWDRTSISKPGMLAKEDPIWQSLWSIVVDKLPSGCVVIAAAGGKVHIQPMGGPDATLAFLNKVKGGG